MFSNGRSSRSSCATSERSSWSSNITAVRSKGRSSVCRSLVGAGAASLLSGSAGGAVGTSGAAWPSGASAVSGCISSSSGFSSSSFCTTSWSSRVLSCRSWIACCSSGVMTTRWLCRRESRVSIAMGVLVPSDLQRKLLAEVDLSGYRIMGDLVGRTGHEDLAIVENVGAIGDCERLAHVVVGDEDADAPLLEPADDLLDVADGDGIDAGEG